MASRSNSAEVEQDREALDQPVGYRLHAAGDEHDAGDDEQRTSDLLDHAEVFLEAREESHEGADTGQRGFTTVTLAHITFSMVFVTTIVQARMLQSDRSIEEAAMDLGSRPWQVLRDVTLPVIFPAIMSGWLLAFTISLDDVVITSFTTGPGSTTLPLLIWSKVKLGVTPDINALATLMVGTVAIGVFIAGIVMHRAERRRQRDEQMAFRANG